jgi:hypothetical protein
MFSRLNWRARLICNRALKIIVDVGRLFLSLYRRCTFWLFWVSQVWLWLLSLHWFWSSLDMMRLLNRCFLNWLLLNRMAFLLRWLLLLLSFFLSMNWKCWWLLLFMLRFLWSLMLGLNDFNFFQCSGLVHHGLTVLWRRLQRLHRVLEGVCTQLRRCPGLRICRSRCHLKWVCRLS